MICGRPRCEAARPPFRQQGPSVKAACRSRCCREAHRRSIWRAGPSGPTADGTCNAPPADSAVSRCGRVPVNTRGRRGRDSAAARGP